MSDSEEDDAHFCLRCKGTFIGLDNYIEHRKVKCKRGESESISNLELQFAKSSDIGDNVDEGKVDIPSGSEAAAGRSWELGRMQSSSPSIKDDSRLEDDLQPDILEMNRKDGMLDTFLPSHDTDPSLKAVDFFSILELQSSKNPTFQDMSAQKGMVTRSKASAAIQAKKNREPFGAKPVLHDYDFEPYQCEHSQYVVGKDVIITDNYNYRKEDGKERKTSGSDSPKMKNRSDERMLEDEGKSEQFLFQEVHNEVTISSEGKPQDETDTSSEESEDEDEDDEYDTRRISTGGKWKPGGGDWSGSSYWTSSPPATHTGGKWKPTPPLPGTLSMGTPSTSSAGSPHDGDLPVLENLSNPDVPKDRNPPPSHTRGKWLPTIDSPERGRVMYWCGPCNRRLSSLPLYEKHCQSDLHHRRTRQESQLEEDLSMENQRASGKREVKRTQNYINSDLWSKSKRKRFRQASDPPDPRQRRGRGSLQCSVCQCRVWPHLIGKHLVSHFHSRRARAAPELAGLLAISHMPSIVLQAPFQCALCRFYCNTVQAFLQHWASREHILKDEQVEGRYSCSFCRVEYSSSSAMYQHLLSEKHKESVAIINGSVPIIIQKKIILRCSVCQEQFRYNFELRRHFKISGHTPQESTASDKYQEREGCSQCSFLAFTKVSLQRHMAQAHKDAQGKFFCSCCDTNFETPADARTHRASAEHKFTVLKKQNNEKELTKECCHCYGIFTGVAELKRHLKEEHPEMAYRCIRCGCHFTLKQELARHVRAGCPGLAQTSTTDSPPAPEDGTFKCSKCAFSSLSQAELLFHLALHSDPVGDPPRYLCPSCPRAFLKTSLKKHLHSHTGEKPYSCRVCGAVFGRKDVLENHVLSVHCVKRAGVSWEARPERQKTVVCEECGASFYDKSALQQHRQIHGGKLFKCEEPGCVYAGRSWGDLRIHLRTHGDERPFHCSNCDFSTKTKAQLLRHARSHLDTKSHHCPHCQFQCNSSTHLNRHLRLHTGAKPFHCPHCDFSCNLLENLRKHVLSTKKHPGKCLYSCREISCDFASNFAKDFRVHLVSSHGQSASAAASFVAGLYNGGEDPRHVDQPLPVTGKKKRPTKPKARECKEIREEDVILDSHPKCLADNPTLASVVFAPSRSEDLLPTVIVSEPSDDVICVQLPAEDAMDAYDGASFFAQGDAFSEMTQRVLFDGLHRQRTISLAESGVLGAEDIEDHGGLIVIDEGMEEVQPSG